MPSGFNFHIVADIYQSPQMLSLFIHRKNDNQSIEVGTQEPLIVVQNSVDSGIVKDGFRWRKYGQKVVKGNSYPR